jgi:hypothetical protein
MLIFGAIRAGSLGYMARLLAEYVTRIIETYMNETLTLPTPKDHCINCTDFSRNHSSIEPRS